MALELVKNPSRSELQRNRRGGRGNRVPAEVRAVEGTPTNTVNHGPHDLPPLGGPPSRWSAELKSAWRMIRDLVPWLRRPDRPLVIRYCRLRVAGEAAYAVLKESDGDGFVLNKAGVMVDSPHWIRWLQIEEKLFRLEAKLGMSPADRTRIHDSYSTGRKP